MIHYELHRDELCKLTGSFKRRATYTFDLKDPIQSRRAVIKQYEFQHKYLKIRDRYFKLSIVFSINGKEHTLLGDEYIDNVQAMHTESLYYSEHHPHVLLGPYQTFTNDVFELDAHIKYLLNDHGPFPDDPIVATFPTVVMEDCKTIIQSNFSNLIDENNTLTAFLETHGIYLRAPSQSTEATVGLSDLPF